MRNAELEGRALEADRLAALLNFRTAHSDTPMIAARVIGASPDSGSLVVNIDRGSRDGIRRDMGVITPDGVVGKIFAVYPDISQVLLMGDKDSGVGALLADTRTQGPVKGTGEPLLSLEYISSDEKVTVGEAVLTSGQDRIFPKDLPVGKVVDFASDPKSPFMKIRVKPAAHLDRLEEVLVLETRQELTLKKSTGCRNRAGRIFSRTEGGRGAGIDGKKASRRTLIRGRGNAGRRRWKAQKSISGQSRTSKCTSTTPGLCPLWCCWRWCCRRFSPSTSAPPTISNCLCW